MRLFLLLTLLTGVSIYGQTYDFATNQFKIPENNGRRGVEYGTVQPFQIININKFLYAVTISGRNVDLTTPIPTELQTLFRLSSAELANTQTSPTVSSALNTTQTQVQKIILLSQEIQSKNAQIRAFNANPVNNRKREFVAQTPQNQLERAIEQLETDSRTYLTNAQNVLNDIDNLKIARVQLINIAKTDQTAAQIAIPTRAVTIPTTAINNYNLLLRSFSAVQVAYNAVLDLDPDEETLSEVTKAFEKIKSGLKTIQDEQIATIFADVTFLRSELLNDRNFTVNSPPIQADGDFINFSGTITPTDANTLAAHRSPSHFTYDIPVYGGWKADFSVGPTFSFGEGAKDEKYFLAPSETDGSVILKERENNNALSPGLAAMMHVYKRSGKNFTYGGMLGVGAGFQSTDDADVSFYLGLSGIVGKRQKIMISSGISFLKVDRLKTEEYIINEEYLTNDINISDVTEKVIKGSFFISVSFNLTNRIERN